MAGFIGQMLTDQGKEDLNVPEYGVDQTVKKMAINGENFILWEDAKWQAVLNSVVFVYWIYERFL